MKEGFEIKSLEWKVDRGEDFCGVVKVVPEALKMKTEHLW